MDEDDLARRANTMRDLRELGAVELERERRTIGFERRPLSPDRRPTTAPSWGYAPTDRDE